MQNLEIVGTTLRSIESVTGRMTRGKVAAAGALSGLWTGLFVGIAFSLFDDRNPSRRATYTQGSPRTI